MRPDSRRRLLAGLFAASAALVAWDRLAGSGLAVAQAVHRPDTAPGMTPLAAPAPAPVVRGQAVAIARLLPRTDYADALAAENAAAASAAAAVAPPSPPALPPVVAAVTPPPPFRVIGKGRVNGGWEVYLAQSNRVLVARQGDRLDGQYEVVAIAPPSLQLMFLPTHEPSTLPIGAAFDD